MMDRIELMGMEFSGCHGCLDFEKAEPQRFLVDAKLYLPLQAAGSSDNLQDTVNYAAVYGTVQSIVEGPSVNLIERLAEMIARRLLQDFPLQAVRVAVHKPQAPIAGVFRDVSVHIKRSRPE